MAVDFGIRPTSSGSSSSGGSSSGNGRSAGARSGGERQAQTSRKKKDEEEGLGSSAGSKSSGSGSSPDYGIKPTQAVGSSDSKQKSQSGNSSANNGSGESSQQQDSSKFSEEASEVTEKGEIRANAELDKKHNRFTDEANRNLDRHGRKLENKAAAKRGENTVKTSSEREQLQNTYNELRERKDRYNSNPEWGETWTAEDQKNFETVKDQLKNENSRLGNDWYAGMDETAEKAEDAYRVWSTERRSGVQGAVGALLQSIGAGGTGEQNQEAMAELDAIFGTGNYQKQAPKDPGESAIGREGQRMLNDAQQKRDDVAGLWEDVTGDMSKAGSMAANIAKTGADVVADMVDNVLVLGSGTMRMFLGAAGSGAMEQMGRDQNDPDSVLAKAMTAGASAYLSNALMGGLESVYGQSVFGGAIKEQIAQHASSPGAQKLLGAVLNTEGFEEGLEDLLGYASNKILGLEANAQLDWNEVKQDAFVGYVVGVLTNGLMGGIEYDANKRRDLADEALEFAESGKTIEQVMREAQVTNKQEVVMRPGAEETAQPQNVNAEEQNDGTPAQSINTPVSTQAAVNEGLTETETQTVPSRAAAPQAGGSEFTGQRLPGATYGGESSVKVGKTKIPVHFAVVPASALNASHDIYGDINPNYPAELQPRDRTRGTAQAQAMNIGANLDPGEVEWSNNSTTGAPIIRPDGTVVSGNGRTLGIEYAMRNGRSAEYTQYLRDNAARFGIDPNSIGEDSILVRVADGDYDWQAMAEQSNVSDVSRMSSTETARVDAERLSRYPEILSMLVPNENGEVNTGDNSDFIREFLHNVIPESEQGSVWTAEGGLSQEGKKRIENAIFQAAYGDAALMARLSESLDNDMKNVTNSLLAVSGKVLTLENGVADGTRYIGVRDSILDGVRLFEKAKREGVTIDQIASQVRAGESSTASAVFIAQFLQNNARSAKQIRTFFNVMTNTAESFGDPTQVSFFDTGKTEFTERDILEGAIREYEQQTGKEPGSLGQPDWDFYDSADSLFGIELFDTRSDKQSESRIPPEPVHTAARRAGSTGRDAETGAAGEGAATTGSTSAETGNAESASVNPENPLAEAPGLEAQENPTGARGNAGPGAGMPGSSQNGNTEAQEGTGESQGVNGQGETQTGDNEGLTEEYVAPDRTVSLRRESADAYLKYLREEKPSQKEAEDYLDFLLDYDSIIREYEREVATRKRQGEAEGQRPLGEEQSTPVPSGTSTGTSTGTTPPTTGTSTITGAPNPADAFFPQNLSTGTPGETPKVSQFSSNTLLKREQPDEYDLLKYLPKQDADTLSNAKTRLNTDLSGEMDGLVRPGAWTDEQVHMARAIGRALYADAARTGDESAYRTWRQIEREHSTENARGLRAYALENKPGAESVLRISEDVIEDIRANLKGGNVSEASIRTAEAETNRTVRRMLDLEQREANAQQFGYQNPQEMDRIKQEYLDMAEEINEIRNTGLLLDTKAGRKARAAISRSDAADLSSKFREMLSHQDLDFIKRFVGCQAIGMTEDLNYKGRQDVLKRMNTFQKLAQLTGTGTWARNIQGNTTFSLIDMLATNTFGQLADIVAGRKTGQRSTGFETGFAGRRNLEAAKQAFERSVLEIAANIDLAEEADTKYDMSRTRTYNPGSEKILERLGSRWEQWNGYMLNSTDAWFKGLTDQSARDAVIRANGWDADNLTATQKQQIDELAKQVAEYRTFQNNGQVAEAADKLRDLANKLGNKNWKQGQFGLGTALMPYTKVPSNIGVKALEFSPIGAAKGVIELMRLKSDATLAQQNQAATDTGRGLMGTAAIAGLAFLMKNCEWFKNWEDEEDKDVYAQNKAEGKSGMQFNLSMINRFLKGDTDTTWQNGDRTVDISSIEPLNQLVTAASLLSEDEEFKTGDLLKKGHALTDAIFKSAKDSLLQLPSVSAIANIENNIKYSQTPEDFGQTLATTIASTAGSVASGFIPAPVRHLATVTDPYARDTRGDNQAGTAVNQILASIPGARQTLAPKTDNFGNDITSGDVGTRLANTYLANRYTQVNQSDVSRQLEQIREETGVSVMPSRNAPKTETYGGEKVKLSADEGREAKRQIGQTFEDGMEYYMRSRMSANADYDDQAAIAKELLDYSKETTKDRIAKEKGMSYDNPSKSAASIGNPFMFVVGNKQLSLTEEKGHDGNWNAVSDLVGQMQFLTERDREAWREKNSTLFTYYDYLTPNHEGKSVSNPEKVYQFRQDRKAETAARGSSGSGSGLDKLNALEKGRRLGFYTDADVDAFMTKAKMNADGAIRWDATKGYAAIYMSARSAGYSASDSLAIAKAADTGGNGSIDEYGFRKRAEYEGSGAVKDYGLDMAEFKRIYNMKTFSLPEDEMDEEW